MTPTQPTPEEQVEAETIALDVLEYEDCTPDGGIVLARAYLALLTRQSQERAELRQFAEFVVALDDPRAVELRRSITLTEIINRAKSALAASPGKGAEGEESEVEELRRVTSGMFHTSAYVKAQGTDLLGTAYQPSPEAAPIEDEEQ